MCQGRDHDKKKIIGGVEGFYGGGGGLHFGER